jgi:multidrug efflux pump subunit AcrA (membrane-fusion protein)
MKTIIITGKIFTMKNSIIIGVSLILFFAGCHNVQIKEDVAVPKAIVEAVTFKSGKIFDEISLQAQSGYLVKNAITAPVNSYVQKTLVMQGDKVQVGQILYEIATKERKATEQSALIDTTYNYVGSIQIKASSAGIVSAMVSQTGDYVTEGTQMCQISSVNSLVFTLQVPFEYNSLIKTGSSCRIALPDGISIQGIIKNELDQMSLNGQTRQYLVRPLSNVFIPENLLATVKIITKTIESPQILPIICVLTNEMMQNFWVMKLINDTTAVKVNVKIGLKNKDEVEITDPLFTPTDRILSQGNYGLSDTALVNVEKH